MNPDRHISCEAGHNKMASKFSMECNNKDRPIPI